MTCNPNTPLHDNKHNAITKYIRLAGGKVAVGYKCTDCGKTSKAWITMEDRSR